MSFIINTPNAWACSQRFFKGRPSLSTIVGFNEAEEFSIKITADIPREVRFLILVLFGEMLEAWSKEELYNQ